MTQDSIRNVVNAARTWYEVYRRGWGHYKGHEELIAVERALAAAIEALNNEVPHG